MNGAPTGQTADLAWLLKNLVERVPHTRSALLLSTDGIKKARHGLSADDADRLAAAASSLCSLTRGIGAHFGHSDGVRQVVAELDDLLLFVAAAGPGAVLAVLAGKEADPNVVGYEMDQLRKQVPSYLATAPRPTATALDNGRR